MDSLYYAPTHSTKTAMNRILHWLVFMLSGLAGWTGALADTVCHESPTHLIVEGPTGEVGTHFLVKYKSAERPAPPCAYRVQTGDFEIRNEDAEYFLALQGELLMLDSGTGPDPRGLIIWDLRKRTKVYSGSYADATVASGSMTFWLETAVATDENCPEARQWRSDGLEAVIETQVQLDFADMRVAPGTLTRCRARQ